MNPEALQQKLEELDQINARAYELALIKLDQIQPRPELTLEAQALRQRLDALATELEMRAPQAYEEQADNVSESTLDLGFFLSEDAPYTSFRIGREIERRKA